MMLKKVKIHVLIFVAILIVSFHNGPVNGKCIHFLDTVAAISDKLYNCQDLQDC